MDQLPKPRAPRYSPAQWEAQKPNIERLYVNEDRPLKEVIQILATDYSFTASEKQIKSRLPGWGLDVKNLKGETMRELARTKAKRKLENKESSFRVYKKPVNDNNIDRYLRRHDISDEALLSMASPINALSPSFSVFTPQSIHSPLPNVDPALDAAPLYDPPLEFSNLAIADSTPSTSANALVPGGRSSPASVADSVSPPRAPLSIPNEHLAITNDGFQPPPHESSLKRSVMAEDWPFRDDLYLSMLVAEEVAEQAVKKPERRYHRSTLWGCDACDEHSGMTSFIAHCPGCGHLRCHMCSFEVVKVWESR